MATWIARDCGCRQEVFNGHKRERFCAEHGNVFESQAAIESRNNRRSSPRRTSEPKRDWTDARAKVEHERCCRICKKEEAPGRPLEAAHVLGREHDEPKVSRTTGEILKELYVDPNRIFPACGPFPAGCHGDAEYRRINVLPYLTLEEQLQAVKDAGGIEAARIRLEPVTYREEVEASAAPTSEGAVG
jgi:hypothetical protein